MAKLSASQNERFEALRRAYLDDVPTRIAAIRAVAAAAERSGSSRAVLEDLRHLVHQFVGSSAVFGLSELSAAARALEDLVIALLERGAPAAAALGPLAAALELKWGESAESRSASKA